MRRIICILLVVLVFGCDKEDTLKSNLKYVDLYAITDDPSDSIKHRVYEIYQQYGVPVYFNDTIGRVFVKDDVYGNPVYEYELLDLAWNFTSYADIKFRYEYMTDPDKQSKALDLIEEFLNLSGSDLYPFNFFVVESLSKEDAEGKIKEIIEGEIDIHFRTLVLTGNWSFLTGKELPGKMMREMVKSKIANYQNLLAPFFEVSKAEWYGTQWIKIDPNFYTKYLVSPNEFEWSGGDVPPSSYFSYSCLYDDWYAINQFTPAGLEKFRAAVRAQHGQFGFVSVGFSYLDTPRNATTDLDGFVSEMLRLSGDEFKEAWGNSPLVMQKYNILDNIITNKLGVKL